MAFIKHIEELVPDYCYSQDFLKEFMKRHVRGDEKVSRILHHIYVNSGISQRYSVLKDFESPGDDGNNFIKMDQDGLLFTPSTKERNDLYIGYAKSMLETVVKRALKHSNTDPASITHLISISCTGFFAPGPGYHIIKTCGLSPHTERINVGFMGCFAAFQGMKMARQIIRSNPEARVLIADIELCTLHLVLEPELDRILSASLFADGAAAVLVDGKEEENSIRLDGFVSELLDAGEEDMAWTIGDSGFDMKLTTYVPKILKSNSGNVINNVLEEFEMTKEEIENWAIHPGGRAILDSIQQSMGLEKDDLNVSRKILADYGNMSSVTILFVLAEMMRQQKKGKTYASAFGPGLTVESGILTLL